MTFPTAFSTLPQAFNRPRGRNFLGAGLAFCAGIPAGGAHAADPPAPAPAPAPAGTEHVTVKAPPAKPADDKLPQAPLNTAQSIDIINKATIHAQAATSLQDVLRYAPGITLNSGEGGAHGDNVNLRGFGAIDSLYLDGIRDPGSYLRDSFDAESVAVLQGPSSVLFGNSSPGGAVNTVSKAATLAPRIDLGVETGTNQEGRATLDADQAIGPHAAIRLNVMGDTSGVAGRDDVLQRRFGFAPTLSLGLGTATTFTLSYFRQQEDNVPDYGIPFLFGKPAPVKTSLYYGLKDHDRTQTNANIASITLKHDFSDGISVTNTLRYGSYWSNYRVTAPVFGNDFAGGPPVPGTPLADILVYRDRPSSQGLQTYLTDHTDITAHFDTWGAAHTLITGVELTRQTTDLQRFDDAYEGADGIAPTPLLSPNPSEPAPPQNTIVARPNIAANVIGLYATDEVRLTKQISVDLGVRFDDYTTSADDVVSNTHFRRTDTGISPKAALIYKPDAAKTFYVSYTTSFDPAASFLSLAPSNTGPAPERAQTWEAGAKLRWLGGTVTSTAAIFHTAAQNITQSDPDDPTVQQQAGKNQRIDGVEVTTSGYLTDTFELAANYTYIDPHITASAVPGEVGKQIPGAARSVGNVWAVYEPNDTWRFGAGMNAQSQRYADALNTARVPGYVVWNAMVSYAVTDDLHVQLNVQNLADARYFTGVYYTDAIENHAIPGQGRVFTLGATQHF